MLKCSCFYFDIGPVCLVCNTVSQFPYVQYQGFPVIRLDLVSLVVGLRWTYSWVKILSDKYVFIAFYDCFVTIGKCKHLAVYSD